MWADFSRTSTFKDAGWTVAELVAECAVGLAVLLFDRAEKEEVSPLRRQAITDSLTGLGNRAFFDRAAKRRLELYEGTVCPSPAPYWTSTTSTATTTATGTGEVTR